MARQPKEEYTEFFDVRVKVGGESGREIQDIVKAKKKADNRPTLANVVEAIILEYGNMKKKK